MYICTVNKKSQKSPILKNSFIFSFFQVPLPPVNSNTDEEEPIEPVLFTHLFDEVVVKLQSIYYPKNNPASKKTKNYLQHHQNGRKRVAVRNVKKPHLHHQLQKKKNMVQEEIIKPNFLIFHKERYCNGINIVRVLTMTNTFRKD